MSAKQVKKGHCKHKVKIPGLDAFLCGNCHKWIATDKVIANINKYQKKGKSKPSLLLKVYS